MIDNKETKYNELEQEMRVKFPYLFEDDNQSGNGGDSDSNDTNDTDGDGASGGSSSGASGSSLTPKELNKLTKALAKQKDFIKGETKKSKLSKSEKAQVDAIESSKAEIKDVNEEATRTRYDGTKYSYMTENKVVVINQIGEGTSNITGMLMSYNKASHETAVNNGFRLGKMLAKKLQVRNDDIKTQMNRQRKGKIDKRLLADLGLGNTKIFEQTYITTTQDAGIHISIDASGSMNGKRFTNALTMATAIAVAMEAVGGIRVRIDVRSDEGSMLVSGSTPTVLVAYDSRKDRLTHIRKYFPKLSTSGGTPEGICFRAIEKLITAEHNSKDVYFINLSDGEPNSDAIDITRRVIKDFKRKGLKVMSYFVSEYTPSNSTKATFDGMYGTDSTEYIETNNMMQIAKTINKLLSNRNN